MRNGSVSCAAACAIALAVACSGAPQKTAAPTSWSFGVDFLSKDAAIQVDTLDIAVFDRATAGSDCPTLVNARTSGADLPVPATPLVSMPVCDVVLKGRAAVTLGYGDYSVLVVAKKNGREFYVGCAEQAVEASEGDAPVVSLTRFSSDVPPPPPSACASVTTFCQHGC